MSGGDERRAHGQDLQKHRQRQGVSPGISLAQQQCGQDGGKAISEQPSMMSSLKLNILEFAK